MLRFVLDKILRPFPGRKWQKLLINFFLIYFQMCYIGRERFVLGILWLKKEKKKGVG